MKARRRTVRLGLLLLCATLIAYQQFTGLVRLSSSEEQQEVQLVEDGGQSTSHQRDNGTIATSQNSGACSGYDGVLLISSGDEEGAAGTIFFLFVLNQIIYAEKHNLIPWIHLSNVSRHVYDPIVHGSKETEQQQQQQQSFEMMCGKNASWASYSDPRSLRQQIRFPAKPVMTLPHLVKCNVSVHGNGIWPSYFEPVSDFSPSDPSCTALPLIRLSFSQLIPGLHNFAPWALRAWRYRGLPPSRRQMDKTYNEWFAPMRQLGHSVASKYIRFLPYIQERAAQQLPTNTNNCLAFHIRHSDKANRRRKIPVANFLPYVQAYYDHHQRSKGTAPLAVFLATDSSKVIEMIQSSWPPEILAVLHWQKGDVVRSNDTTAVFQMVAEPGLQTTSAGVVGHHQTNLEVLTDILTMSKCQYLLHGLSAVTEAVHYLNPDLHNKNASVNLDDQKKDQISVAQFQEAMKRNDNALSS